MNKLTNDIYEGRYLVTTASGSRHLFDMGAKTVTRQRGEEANETEMDEEPMELVEIIGCEVGVMGEWTLRDENLWEKPLYRRTTGIVSIEDLQEGTWFLKMWHELNQATMEDRW